MSSLHWRITLRLFADEKAFGSGIATLLEGISATGSIRRAASDMGMAYSKAWSILGSSEKVLGFALVERQTGGKQGGGCILTAKGADLLRRYRQLEKLTHQSVEDLFAQTFSDFEW